MIYHPEQKSREERRFLAYMLPFVFAWSTSLYREGGQDLDELRRSLDIHDDRNRVIPHSYRTQFRHSLDGVYEYNENLRHFGHTRTSIRDSGM